jgi:chromosome segregation ATPase
MRKAFDANVPKLKPRLKTAIPPDSLPLESRVDDAPPAVRAPMAAPSTMASMARAVEARRVEPVSAPQVLATQADDLDSRRERLDKIKRRVAEAARPRARAEPAPGDPSRAAQQVLGLAHDLEAELAGAREREAALRADLDATRVELARTAAEAREAQARAAAVEAAQ